jgi:hypothetical protein
MPVNKFVFLQALPLGRSKREQELEQAKARSHAAKVVHRRAKETRGDGQEQATFLAGKHRFEQRGRVLQRSDDEDFAVSMKHPSRKPVD